MPPANGDSRHSDNDCVMHSTPEDSGSEGHAIETHDVPMEDPPVRSGETRSSGVASSQENCQFASYLESPPNFDRWTHSRRRFRAQQVQNRSVLCLAKLRESDQFLDFE
jgi:hypothetical protein